jgi:hypothetical protein
MRALKALAASGEPDMFITLTVNPDQGESPEERARMLVEAWRKARRAAIRRYQLDGLPFLAVFEKTKRGEPHLHILARSSYIPQKWLSDFMAAEINSPIVDIRRIKGQKQAVNYVTKYVGKAPFHFDGVKRYWRSQDYERKNIGEDGGSKSPHDVFDVIFADFWTYVQLQAMQGGFGGWTKDGRAVLTGACWENRRC